MEVIGDLAWGLPHRPVTFSRSSTERKQAQAANDSGRNATGVSFSLVLGEGAEVNRRANADALLHGLDEKQRRCPLSRAPAVPCARVAHRCSTSP